MSERRTIRTILLLTGCTIPLMIIVALVVAVGISMFRMNPNEGESDFAKKGYPDTLEELDAWYPEPPEGENAADLYMKAGERLYLSRSHAREFVPYLGDVEMPELGQPVPDAMGNFIDVFIDDEAEAFTLIDQAVQFEGSRYPVKYEIEPSGDPVSYFDLVRAVQKGQRLRVISAVRRGDPDAALDEFEKLVHVSRSMGNEPTAMAAAVTTSMEFSAARFAQFVLDAFDLSTSQLDRLDSLIAQLFDEDSTLRGLVGERAILLHKPVSDTGFGWIQMLGQRDVVKELETYIDVLETGLPEALDAYTALRAREYSTFRVFTAIIAPTYARAVGAHYVQLASVSAARTAIAIEEWRNEGNSLPESMDGFPDAIQSAWPIDPFSGKPLIYRYDDEGYAIYSVGPDLQDDAGATGGKDEDDEPDREKAAAKDVVFRILK